MHGSIIEPTDYTRSCDSQEDLVKIAGRVNQCFGFQKFQLLRRLFRRCHLIRHWLMVSSTCSHAVFPNARYVESALSRCLVSWRRTISMIASRHHRSRKNRPAVTSVRVDREACAFRRFPLLPPLLRCASICSRMQPILGWRKKFASPKRSPQAAFPLFRPSKFRGRLSWRRGFRGGRRRRRLRRPVRCGRRGRSACHLLWWGCR